MGTLGNEIPKIYYAPLKYNEWIAWNLYSHLMFILLPASWCQCSTAYTPELTAPGADTFMSITRAWPTVGRGRTMNVVCTPYTPY